MKGNGEIVQFFKQKNYEMINNDLGFGSFGKAVLLKDPFIDELFVAKKYEPYIEQDRKEFYDSFLREIKIMYKLNHKNVVRIYNYYAYESYYTGYILMEYIDGQPLDEYLEKVYTLIDDKAPDDLFIQLIDGFAYIEKQGIIHRDIREGNILVTKDGIVKIIDFGLGKTFSPIKLSKDSMAKKINHLGVDRLPDEYAEGKYDSITDMFYLAELFNRLLRNTKTDVYFSYNAIIEKMMKPNRKDRYSSFSEIKEAIRNKDFSTMQISEEDKEIYQSFSNAVIWCIGKFKANREFVSEPEEFIRRLRNVIKENCFENIVQNICDLVYVIVKNGFTYYQNRNIECSTLIEFEKWFSSLSKDSQKLVLDNMISKLSVIKIEEPEDEIPF